MKRLVGLVWQSIFISAVACVGIVLLAALIGHLVHFPSGVNGVTWGLSFALVLLAAIDWIPVVLLGRRILELKRPAIALEDQFQRLLIESLTASFLALLGLNYLIGSPLPKGANFFLLVAAVLLVSVPPLHFMLKTYREA